jgi:hypothetical protein|tara:strand:+ start:146 stop:466 length:321 start_codon:yes stop_codon:yes gene_type:complete
MARFILDIANKDRKLSNEEYNKIIDIYSKNFGGFISTITLIDDTNENQFYEEELLDDPTLNDLNEEQINNFKKLNREVLKNNPTELNIHKLKNNLNKAGLNVIVFD